MNKYSLEVLEAFNSLDEDFAIWECKMMVLEHNIIIQENFIKNTIQKGINKASEGAKRVNTSIVNKSVNAEQKLNDVNKTIKSNVSKLNVIKATKDKLVQLFKSIYAKFIGIFKKFKEVALRLFKKDQAWLNEYKSVILNTDLTKFNYQHEMFAYWNGQQYFSKMTPRSLNENDREQINALESVDKFKEYLVNKHIPTKASIFKKNDNYINNLKTVFRGETVAKLKPAQLQDMLGGIIEFCNKYKDIDAELRKELDNITKASKDAENKAKKINTSRIQNSVDPNKDTANKLESFFLFFEADDVASNKDIVQNNKQNMEVAKQNIDKKKSDSNNSNNKNLTITKQESDLTAQDMIKNLNKYKVYLNVCSTILSTKLEILEEKYHAYMGLLRAIVNLGLYQSKDQQDSGKSYNNRTDEIENGHLSKAIKKAKQKSREAMK